MDELEAAFENSKRSQAAKDTYQSTSYIHQHAKNNMEPAAMCGKRVSGAKTIIVAAAGNDAKQTLTPPHRFQHPSSLLISKVFRGVGALNQDGTLTASTTRRSRQLR